MVYDKPNAGEWIQPVPRGYKLACCDCGLVHRMDFRISKRRVQFRVFLHKRATAQMRVWMRRKSATVRVEE